MDKYSAAYNMEVAAKASTKIKEAMDLLSTAVGEYADQKEGYMPQLDRIKRDLEADNMAFNQEVYNQLTTLIDLRVDLDMGRPLGLNCKCNTRKCIYGI